MCNSQAPLSYIDRVPVLHKNHLKVRTLHKPQTAAGVHKHAGSPVTHLLQ